MRNHEKSDYGALGLHTSSLVQLFLYIYKQFLTLRIDGILDAIQLKRDDLAHAGQKTFSDERMSRMRASSSSK